MVLAKEPGPEGRGVGLRLGPTWPGLVKPPIISIALFVLLFLILAGPAVAGTKEAPALGQQPWFWWTVVNSPRPTLGYYGHSGSKLLRLEVSQGQATPERIEALARMTRLITGTHRIIGSGPSQVETLEPILSDGQWYLLVSSPRAATVEVIARVTHQGFETVAMTRMSLYPPYLASKLEKNVQTPVKLPSWPLMLLDGSKALSWWVRAGVPLKLKVAPSSEGVVLALDGLRLMEVHRGNLDHFVYVPPEDRQVDRLGRGHSREVSLLADLGSKGRVSFSFEVNRNQALHSSFPQALGLLGLSVLLGAVGVAIWRFVGHKTLPSWEAKSFLGRRRDRENLMNIPVQTIDGQRDRSGPCH
jgi:hypothetical protein